MRQLLREQEILDAMSVIPLAWLTASNIADEMNYKDIGARQVIPILKNLLRKGLVIREKTNRVIEWHVSDSIAESVLAKWNKSHPTKNI